MAPLARDRPSNQAGTLNVRRSRRPPSERLLTGTSDSADGHGAGLLNTIRSRMDSSPANTWIIDAGKGMVDSVLKTHLRSRAVNPLPSSATRGSIATGKTFQAR